jgi:cytochrome c553
LYDATQALPGEKTGVINAPNPYPVATAVFDGATRLAVFRSTGTLGANAIEERGPNAPPARSTGAATSPVGQSRVTPRAVCGTSLPGSARFIVIVASTPAPDASTLNLADAAIKPFSLVVLRDLQVKPKNAETLLTIAEVRASYSLMAILGGTMAVNELAISSPTISLVQNADGTSNAAALETCGTCHGSGRAADVKVMHNVAGFTYN